MRINCSPRSEELILTSFQFLQEEVRRNLRAALGHLPEPTNEYEILVPQLPADEKDEGDDMEMDMADAVALQRKEQEAAELALWKKQSQVIQRALPRPPVAAIQAIKSTLSLEDDGKNAYVSSLEHADLSIRQEMVALLENDAAKYPVTEEVVGKDKKKGTAAVSKRPQIDAPALEDFEQEDINQVRSFLTLIYDIQVICVYLFECCTYGMKLCKGCTSN